VIDESRSAEKFAVDAKLLNVRIDSRTQIGHELSVHLDAPFSDQILALAAAPYSCIGQGLLNPNRTARGDPRRRHGGFPAAWRRTFETAWLSAG
jgi:hypothetical protein